LIQNKHAGAKGSVLAPPKVKAAKLSRWRNILRQRLLALGPPLQHCKVCKGDYVVTPLGSSRDRPDQSAT